MDQAHTRAGLTGDYAAWRDRMRAKAERNRQIIDLTSDGHRAGAGASSTGDADTSRYWDPADLFEDPGPQEPASLAVLDLAEGASPEEIVTAYRRLAKLHHPDRWANTDRETRAHHEEAFRAVTRAYHELRERQQA